MRIRQRKQHHNGKLRWRQSDVLCARVGQSTSIFELDFTDGWDVFPSQGQVLFDAQESGIWMTILDTDVDFFTGWCHLIGTKHGSIFGE